MRILLGQLVLRRLGRARRSFVTQDPLGNPVDQRHPWNQTTIPRPQKRDLEGGNYSWVMSPRWYDKRTGEHLALDTGGGPLARLWATALAGLVDTPYVQRDRQQRARSTCRRRASFPEMRVRVEDPAVVEHDRAQPRPRLLHRLRGGDGALLRRQGDGASARRATCKVFQDFEVPDEAIGCGFHEAVRGVLSHHLVIRDGKIANYHPYPPTPWNASPRDSYGTPGPYEDAVQGMPHLRGERPGRTSRASTSCARCAASIRACRAACTCTSATAGCSRRCTRPRSARPSAGNAMALDPPRRPPSGSRRIDELIDRVEELPDPEPALELVRALLDLYGEALERILAAGGDELAARLADDDLVSHLLLLHDLHPLDAAERRAPGGTAGPAWPPRTWRSTARWPGYGCGAAAAASARGDAAAVEEAIRNAAPEIARVEVEEAPPAARADLGRRGAPYPARARGREVSGLRELIRRNRRRAAERPAAEAEARCELCAAPGRRRPPAPARPARRRAALRLRGLRGAVRERAAGEPVRAHRRPAAPPGGLRARRRGVGGARGAGAGGCSPTGTRRPGGSWPATRARRARWRRRSNRRCGPGWSAPTRCCAASPRTWRRCSWTAGASRRPATGSCRSTTAHRLVAVLRTRWRGLAGGPEVWAAVAAFFDELRERARTASARPRPPLIERSSGMTVRQQERGKAERTGNIMVGRPDARSTCPRTPRA